MSKAPISAIKATQSHHLYQARRASPSASFGSSQCEAAFRMEDADLSGYWMLLST